MANFPTSIDSYSADTNIVGGVGGTTIQAEDVNEARDFAIAVQTKVGVDGDTLAASTLEGRQKYDDSGGLRRYGSSIASASSITLPDNYSIFRITGTTTIATVVAPSYMRLVYLEFAAALTLSHGTSNLSLTGGADLTVAAGDVVALEWNGTSWHQVSGPVGGVNAAALRGTLIDPGLSPADGQTFVWNAITNQWEAADGPAPSGAAGGDLTGTYPNPTVAALAITDAKVAAANKDGTVGTASLRTLGTGAQQACAGNDSRLSNARTPTGSAGGDLSGTYPNPAIGVMTTLGDLLYRGASAVARLAGNTVATRKFLVQTGTGSVSAAPGWDTLQAADLPSHDHTGTSDGGKLTNDVHDGYEVLEEIAAPSSPVANTLRLYAKDDGGGLTELFYKNSAGTERDLGAAAAGALASHNHTAGAGDGGVLTNDEHDGFSEYAEMAAPSTPASGKVRVYPKSDKKLYLKDSTGTETDLTGTGGGGGALTQLAETIVGVGGAANIPFGSISGSYRHLRLVVVGRSDTSADNTTLRLQFNGDTGSNYDSQDQYGNNTTTSAAAAVAGTSLHAGYVTGATATSGAPGLAETLIGDYARTAWHKLTRTQAAVFQSTAAGGCLVLHEGGRWRSTSAITSILVFPGAGAFVEGTVATLYGIS